MWGVQRHAQRTNSCRWRLTCRSHFRHNIIFLLSGGTQVVAIQDHSVAVRTSTLCKRFWVSSLTRSLTSKIKKLIWCQSDQLQSKVLLPQKERWLVFFGSWLCISLLLAWSIFQLSIFSRLLVFSIQIALLPMLLFPHWPIICLLGLQ